MQSWIPKRKRSEDNAIEDFKIWPIVDANLTPESNFPELDQRIVTLDDKSVGIALSGGGSRSHALCLGYLRALRDLKLHENDKVQYISAVSGGSWASSLFTYADMNDNELLGESLFDAELKKTRPIDMNLLDTKPPGALGSVLYEFNSVMYVLWLRITGTKASDIWQKVIAKGILRQFGLENKVMSHSEDHKLELLNKYPNLKDKIVVSKKNRPFMIINACLGGPLNHSTGWGNSLQITSLYTGVPFYRKENGFMNFYKLTFRNKLKRMFAKGNYLLELQNREDQERTRPDERLKIGGGVVESCLFGNSRTENIKKVRYFQLQDAIGTSSAAFSSMLQNYDFLDYYNPTATYFSPTHQRTEEYFEKKMTIFDGGLYENTGLLPLLQRGLKKAICFINSAVPFDETFEEKEYFRKNSKDEFEYSADTQLLCLFGQVQAPTKAFNYTSNHVFVAEQLDKVMSELKENKNKGVGAVAKVVLTTVDNEYWNIKGGIEVEVMFVYNEKCNNFESLLENDVKEEIDKDNSSFGEYPFVKTVFQNDHVLQLDQNEVNLLSAQAEFILKQNKDMLLEMFE